MIGLSDATISEMGQQIRWERAALAVVGNTLRDDVRELGERGRVLDLAGVGAKLVVIERPVELPVQPEVLDAMIEAGVLQVLRRNGGQVVLLLEVSATAAEVAA